jgi:hypothetical protein
MKPVRDTAYLKFIRSLPCCVCFRDRGIEAAHIGRRGMAQKCSDRETIPLCSAHHREQHRIGLREFAKVYELDVWELINQLQERPRITTRHDVPTNYIRGGQYVATYRGTEFLLFPVVQGLVESVELAKHLCREYLIETFFVRRANAVESQPALES